MNKHSLQTAAFLALAAVGPLAQAAGCPGLFFSGGYVRAPAPGATTVAAYGFVENSTASPVTVTGVTAEGFAGASIHQSMSGNGMAGMAPVDKLVVPAKGRAEFAPGGTHIMLSAPTGQLRPKDSVRLKLQCDTGSLSVTLPVEAAN